MYFPVRHRAIIKTSDSIMMSSDSGPELHGAWAPPHVHSLRHGHMGTLAPIHSAETYVSAHTKCQWIISQMVSQHAQICACVCVRTHTHTFLSRITRETARIKQASGSISLFVFVIEKKNYIAVYIYIFIRNIHISTIICFLTKTLKVSAKYSNYKET